MNRFSLTITVILLVYCLPIVAEGKGWRGIVPLRSTRADVERLLGPGTRGHYQFDEERAHVNYQEGDCNPVNGCLCLVPKGTVISIYVQLEVEMRFSKLNIDKKKYEKNVSPEDPTVATYANDKEGIIYTVNEENDDVTAIEYIPTAKDCKDVMKRGNRAGVRSCRRQAPIISMLGQSSLLALLVLHDEGGDDSDNVLLLTARELGHILKNFPQFAGWSTASLHRHRPPLVFSKSTISTSRTSAILGIRTWRLFALLPEGDV